MSQNLTKATETSNDEDHENAQEQEREEDHEEANGDAVTPRGHTRKGKNKQNHEDINVLKWEGVYVGDLVDGIRQGEGTVL